MLSALRLLDRPRPRRSCRANGLTAHSDNRWQPAAPAGCPAWPNLVQNWLPAARALMELTPRTKTLEEIFLSLTSEEADRDGQHCMRSCKRPAAADLICLGQWSCILVGAWAAPIGAGRAWPTPTAPFVRAARSERHFNAHCDGTDRQPPVDRGHGHTAVARYAAKAAAVCFQGKALLGTGEVLLMVTLENGRILSCWGGAGPH